MQNSAVYSGEYGYHYPQQANYPVSYQQGYNNYYPANYRQTYYPTYYSNQVPQVSYAQYYPSYYPQQHGSTCYCPSCGNPVYIVYVGEQQGNKNGIAAIVIATLILVALDILFLRQK